ncbi:MAG: GTPase HflX [Candidatus Thermoplasmatota archaeon]|nr:GTPase HflX [Candidatus Thermoplasmatota archaeon]
MDDKKAIIISLQDNNDEIERLAKSLGYSVIKTFIQHRDKPNPSFYIGGGKIKEIKEYVEKRGVRCVIVNEKLHPSQWYNMENFLNVKVYDRIRLILDIFADRAKRKEAKLQVKLAYLRYERSYIRELIHRAKTGEHPGFMGGGEYQVANYYEMIKKQMKRIKEELEKIGQERESHRRYRWKKGFYLIAVAGYTNAGKSSLLNRLTGEHVKVEERLFSTLSTTTRAIKQKKGTKTIPILITDTIGFIRDLPHWLVDSFHSTLEEIELSDMVILLVDIGEEVDTLIEKTELSIKEIMSMRAHPNVIVGLNKADKISKREKEMKLESIKKIIGNRPYVFLSAKTGENIEQLIELVYDLLPNNVIMEIKFPQEAREDLSSIFNEDVDVLDFGCTPDGKICISCSDRLKEKVMGRLIKRGAQVKII